MKVVDFRLRQGNLTESFLVFVAFVRGSPCIAQAGLGLTILPRLAENSSCLATSAGAMGV